MSLPGGEDLMDLEMGCWSMASYDLLPAPAGELTSLPRTGSHVLSSAMRMWWRDG